MIHEVDEALRRLIRDEALRGSDLDVVFDAPTKDWAARRNAPTINLYLYDLREDMRRRNRGMINRYAEGKVTARHLPPHYYKLSYLLSAWTQRTEDEHRLLSTLLLALLRYESLPLGLMPPGRIVEMGMDVPLTVALPPPEDRSFADVWQALGGELKPSIDIVVSVPVDFGMIRQAAVPPETGLIVGMHSGEATDEPVGHDMPPPDEADRGVGTKRRSPVRAPESAA